MEETNDNTNTGDDSKSHKILQVTARMFQQHADLLEHQAAILRRMSSRPDSPTAWEIEESSPESYQKQQLVKEKTEALVIKSYEGMLQIQKRVDYLQNQMTRNGITQVRRYLTADKKEKKMKGKSLYKIPFLCFKETYGPTVAKEFGVESDSEYNVQIHLMKQWEAMTPEDRSTYEELAKRELSKGDECENLNRKKMGRPREEASRLTIGIESTVLGNDLEKESDERNPKRRSIQGAIK